MLIHDKQSIAELFMENISVESDFDGKHGEGFSPTVEPVIAMHSSNLLLARQALAALQTVHCCPVRLGGPTLRLCSVSPAVHAVAQELTCKSYSDMHCVAQRTPAR